MGMGPRSHTQSPPHQPRVLHGVQTRTAVACEALLRDLLSCSPVPHRTLPLEADPGEVVVTQEGGRGTLVCSPPRCHQGQRESEERKWNTHQPLNRGGFLNLRLLTKSPQLTSITLMVKEASPLRSGARHRHLRSPLLTHTILEVLSEQLGQKRKQKAHKLENLYC